MTQNFQISSTFSISVITLVNHFAWSHLSIYLLLEKKGNNNKMQNPKFEERKNVKNTISHI